MNEEADAGPGFAGFVEDDEAEAAEAAEAADAEAGPADDEAAVEPPALQR